MSAEAVARALEELGLPFERVDIDPAYADTAAFCEKYDYPLAQSCNTIIVASKKEPKTFAACSVLATRRLDVNKRVRKLMGVSRLSFASAEEMKTLTGMEVGGVTPPALPADLKLYVDDAIMNCEWIIIGSGDRAAKIKIAPALFERLPNAEIISELANPL
ncbi:MAG: hypothetical protein COB53_12745 [Elusimicrobia bacterium]|nr:MAG: hypothetical protein COB53_12745 [Elusimicrobiota bacterium]